MVLTKIREGDTVLVDKRGRRFEARITKIGKREVEIVPIDSRFNYFHATSTEVKEVLVYGPLWKRKSNHKKTRSK